MELDNEINRPLQAHTLGLKFGSLLSLSLSPKDVCVFGGAVIHTKV